MSGIKHIFVSPIADENNPGEVGPGEWNDDHTIDGNIQLNGFNVDTTGAFIEFTIDSDGVPNTALTITNTETYFIGPRGYAQIDGSGFYLEKDDDVIGNGYGPICYLVNGSSGATLADLELIGSIGFDFYNTNDVLSDPGASIAAYVLDNLAGSEDSYLDFNVRVAGANTNILKLGGTGSTFTTAVTVCGALTATSITTPSLTVTGALAAGSLTVSGSTTTGTLTVTGAAGVGSLTSSGAITSGGLLTGNAGIKANGGLTVSGTTTLAATNITGALTVCGSSSFGAVSVSGTLGACGAVTFGSTLNVGGTSTLAGTNITGTLNVCGATNLGALSVSGTSTLAGTNITGTLNVCGAANFGSVTVSGTLGVSGTSTFGGLMTANAGLKVNGGATVSGTLAACGALTVGAGATITGTLSVCGATNLGSLTVSGTLGACGAATFGSTVDVTGLLTALAAAKVNGGLTVSGTLAACGAATVGGTLNVNGVTTVSGLVVLGTLAVSGTSTLNGAVSINNTLSVSGTSTFIGAVTACGTVTVNNTLTATTLSVTGNATITGTLGVNGVTTLSGLSCATLTVTGTSTFTGLPTFNAGIKVNGGATVSGTLAACGAVTVGTTLDVGGVLTALAAAKVNGGLTVSGTLAACGALTVGGTSTLAGTNITGTLTVCGASNFGAVTVSGTLGVCGAATFGSTVAVNGVLTASGVVVLGTLTVSGITTINNTLNVSTLAVTGNATITGTLGVNGLTTVSGLTCATLSVTGTSTFTGLPTFNAGIKVNGGATVSGTLAACGAVTVGSTLNAADWVGGATFRVAGANYLQMGFRPTIVGGDGLGSGYNVLTSASGDIQHAENGAAAGIIFGANGTFNIYTEGSSVSGTIVPSRVTVGACGAVTMTSTLTVCGATTLKSTLAVCGAATFGGTVLIGTDANLDKALFWDDLAGTVAQTTLATLTTEVAPAAGDYLLVQRAEDDLVKVNWSSLPGVGGGISNVVEDASPQLGGFLDLNAFYLIDNTLTNSAAVFFNEDDEFEIFTDATGDIGVELVLNHASATPAADDVIGTITYRGKDSGGNQLDYSSIQTWITDPLDTAESCVIYGYVMNNGAAISAFGLGEQAGGVFTNFQSGSVLYPAQFANTDSTGFGVGFASYNESASPATNDQIFIFDFTGNSIGATGALGFANYAQMGVIATDVTTATEDSIFLLNTMEAGSLQEAVRFSSFASTISSPLTVCGATVLSSTLKFTSDPASILDPSGNEMLVLNQTASAVNYLELVNGATGGAPGFFARGDDTNVSLYFATKATGSIVFETPSAGGATTFKNSVSGGGPLFQIINDTPAAGDNDYTGSLRFVGKNDNASPEYITHSRLDAYMTDVSDSTEDSKLDSVIYSAGSALTALSLGGPTLGSVGHTLSTGSMDAPYITVHNTNAGTNCSNLAFFQQSASPLAGDSVGAVSFWGMGSTGGVVTYGEIRAGITDATALSEDAQLVFQVTVCGVNATRLTLASSATFTTNVTVCGTLSLNSGGGVLSGTGSKLTVASSGGLTLVNGGGINSSTSYFSFYDPVGVACFQAGVSGVDESNYYDNTTHRFRTRGAGANIVYISACGILPAANDAMWLGVSGLAFKSVMTVSGYNISVSGGTFIRGGLLTNVQYYTVTGGHTWSKPTGLNFIVVECQGGGAGGGAVAAGISGGGSGGGGAGGYCRRKIAASSLAATETITVASGGASAVAGGSVSFGTTPFMTACGGNPGISGAGANLGGLGGCGGLATSGDINVQGGYGDTGVGFTVSGGGRISFGGGGGASFFGGGGAGATAVTGGSSAGTAGTAFGSGGGGVGGSGAGGAGKTGCVIVWEYM